MNDTVILTRAKLPGYHAEVVAQYMKIEPGYGIEQASADIAPDRLEEFESYLKEAEKVCAALNAVFATGLPLQAGYCIMTEKMYQVCSLIYHRREHSNILEVVVLFTEI